MEYDEIPHLPYIEDKNESFKYEDLVKAKNKFIFYQDEQGIIKLSYSKLNAELYACLIASLANPSFIKVYEFLKLVLEDTRLVKQNNKKSFEMAVRIEKYLK